MLPCCGNGFIPVSHLSLPSEELQFIQFIVYQLQFNKAIKTSMHRWHSMLYLTLLLAEAQPRVSGIPQVLLQNCYNTFTGLPTVSGAESCELIPRKKKNLECIMPWYYASGSCHSVKWRGGDAHGTPKYTLIHRGILKVIFIVLFILKVQRHKKLRCEILINVNFLIRYSNF